MTNLSPKKRLLNNTGVDDLSASIRCSVTTDRPYSLQLLLDSLEDEQLRNSPRKGVIRLLEREIKRQKGGA